MKQLKKRGVKGYPQEFIDEQYNLVLEMVKNGESIRNAISKCKIGDETFYKRVSAVKLAELKLQKSLKTDYSHRKLY